MPKLAQRVGVFTESVIRDMTRLAIQHGAINLAQGFPDFPAPDELKDAAVNAIRADHNQYTITWGMRDLREAIAAKAERYNGIKTDPERDIVVTCGATEGMMASMLAIIDPGDEVIVFEPFYENYGPDTSVSGAQPVYVALREPSFGFDFDELRAAFSAKTKAIIINTPNNPSGHVFSREELSFIADLCQQHDVVAVTDEIYEHILFGEHQHVSIATLPGMADRTITISGFSKTYSITGWRIGYVIAQPPLMDGIRKVHDFLTVGAPAPLQAAGVTALSLGEEYYETLKSDYERRRSILYDALQLSGFHCYQPQGAYYIMADFTNIRPDLDDTQFAMFLTEEIGVAPVPGSSFYSRRELGSTKVRFTFSKGDDTLKAAAERLQALRIRA
jgi:aspartate/methionine/tyrosine aminotransferase